MVEGIALAPVDGIGTDGDLSSQLVSHLRRAVRTIGGDQHKAVARDQLAGNRQKRLAQDRLLIMRRDQDSDARTRALRKFRLAAGKQARQYLQQKNQHRQRKYEAGENQRGLQCNRHDDLSIAESNKVVSASACSSMPCRSRARWRARSPMVLRISPGVSRQARIALTSSSC